ncbi:MAG: CooT family nickel-binding protein [Candidatus Bathyarchaeia archaeon]|nr:CooT family nickel-binding protein [Candidatus Bathyarchaeota archaeon]
MCEFKVFLDGEKIFEGAVYAKSAGNTVLLRDILGGSKSIEKVKILEVDVTSERLTLTRL